MYDVMTFALDSRQSTMFRLFYENDEFELIETQPLLFE